MLRESFRHAVDNIAKYGDTDVFPFPAENHVFHDMRDKAVSLLVDTNSNFADRLNTNSMPGESAMAPAGYTGFRWVTQLDPLWNALLLGLVIEIAEEAEQVRVDRAIVYSHRLASEADRPDLFTQDAYAAYDAASVETAQAHEWVVVTDIADFYPRIYHHTLERALGDTGQKSDAHKKIEGLLKVFSKGTSYGLPVGGPAARMLSELVLNRSDKRLLAKRIVFHRYADDYRLFASSRESAYRALTELSRSLLEHEGLSLAKAKTRIMTSAEFIATVSATEHDDPAEGHEHGDRRRRSRELLGLTLRYDPYSETAEDDFEALKDAVEQIDIVDLFMVELAKPRIDSRLTRRLLRALRAADPVAKAQICTSLAQNFEVLAPLVPQVLQAIRPALNEIEPELASEARDAISTLVADRSHIFDLGVNRGFAIRVLADDPERRYETQLIGLFDQAAPFEKRDIVIAMARWGATYWLEEKKNQYSTLHPWVQRSFLMSSFFLSADEGQHWRNSVKNGLTGFDDLVRDWVGTRKHSDANWELPL